MGDHVSALSRLQSGFRFRPEPGRARFPAGPRAGPTGVRLEPVSDVTERSRHWNEASPEPAAAIFVRPLSAGLHSAHESKSQPRAFYNQLDSPFRSWVTA